MEETTWFNCDIFGKMAEGVGRYIKKGGLVHINGRIATRKHDDKYYWSVAVDKVTLIGKPPEEQQGQQGQWQGGRQTQQEQFNAPAVNLDEIPF